MHAKAYVLVVSQPTKQSTKSPIKFEPSSIKYAQELDEDDVIEELRYSLGWNIDYVDALSTDVGATWMQAELNEQHLTGTAADFHVSQQAIQWLTDQHQKAIQQLQAITDQDWLSPRYEQHRYAAEQILHPMYGTCFIIATDNSSECQQLNSYNREEFYRESYMAGLDTTHYSLARVFDYHF